MDMFISDVMERTGLSRKAIYLYEEKGLLNPGKESKGELRQYRIYDEDDVRRLELIARLREIGISIPDISRIIAGEKADLVLQAFLKQQQEQLGTLLDQMAQTTNLLKLLPPNTDLEGLYDRISNSQDFHSTLDRSTLDDYFSESDARHMAMLLYEAFLDKPVRNAEQWKLWNDLLDELQANLTDEALEAYQEFYGSLSTKQLCDDYALRRELVCGYTFYSDKEEKEKAEEIFTELKKLLTDENLYSRWNSFYNRIALQSVSSERTNEYLYQLSDVYESYQEHFNNVYSKYLTPMLETEAGSCVKTLIREKMNPIDMFSFFGLIYFDFYNHTLRQVTA